MAGQGALINDGVVADAISTSAEMDQFTFQVNANEVDSGTISYVEGLARER